MPALYFLGNRLLATGSPLLWSDTQVDFTNPAFLCPKCGEVWGRVQNNPNSEWLAVRRSCSKHPQGDADEAAGSFLAPWRRKFAELPPEVLIYEATLRLNRFKD